MKSKAKIQLEFQQVTAQARELERCADQLADARRKLDALMEELGAGWVGESANAYFEKCGLLSDKLVDSQKDLDRVAGVIHRSAKAFRDAELAALALIQDN